MKYLVGTHQDARAVFAVQGENTFLRQQVQALDGRLNSFASQSNNHTRRENNNSNQVENNNSNHVASNVRAYWDDQHLQGNSNNKRPRQTH